MNKSTEIEHKIVYKLREKLFEIEDNGSKLENELRRPGETEEDIFNTLKKFIEFKNDSNSESFDEDLRDFIRIAKDSIRFEDCLSFVDKEIFGNFSALFNSSINTEQESAGGEEEEKKDIDYVAKREATQKWLSTGLQIMRNRILKNENGIVDWMVSGVKAVIEKSTSFKEMYPEFESYFHEFQEWQGKLKEDSISC